MGNSNQNTIYCGQAYFNTICQTASTADKSRKREGMNKRISYSLFLSEYEESRSRNYLEKFHSSFA